MNNNQDYDVIVIGTGIGGSGCAAWLSAEGLKTLVIEKNSFVGGMSSTYEKKGFKLDSAIHVFSNGLKGRFGKIMKKIQLNNLKFVNIVNKTAIRALGQKGYTKLTFTALTGSSSSYKKETQKNKSTLNISKIPNLKEIEKKFDLSKMGFKEGDIGVLIKIISDVLSTSRKTIRKMYEEKLTLEQYLSRYNPSNGVKSFFAFLIGGMFGIPPRIASAPAFIQGLTEWIIKNDLSYPIGGAIAVPSAFLEGVKKFGGKILLNTKVSKIIVENNKAIGVKLENGDEIYAKCIISNAGIKPTVFKLVGTEYFEPNYLDKIKNLKSSYSAITFKFALNEPIIDDLVFVNLFHGDLSVFGEKERTPKGPKATGFMVMIPTNADPSLAPPGHQIVIFGTLAPTRKKNWKDWTEYYYNQILKFYPDIEDKMLFVDITTPEDLAKLSGKEFGPIETTALIPDQSGPFRISSELPIENLYVVGDSAGTDTYGIGTQLAADSAIKLAKYLTNKLKLKKLN